MPRTWANVTIIHWRKGAFAYALQLEADLWQKRVQEADVDAALADKNDDEGAEVGVEHGAAAGV
jgi:hypothetical protein